MRKEIPIQFIIYFKIIVFYMIFLKKKIFLFVLLINFIFVNYDDNYT